MRQARRGRAVVAGLLVALTLVGCSSGGDAKPIAETHPPVSSSRKPVLPDPPFALEPLDPQVGAARYMTGSPDRLVVLSDYGDDWYVRGEPTLPPAKRKLAQFDFRRWRWNVLPKPRYDPVALPDGLAGVGLKCGPDQDSNRKCHVEVSTLRWDDERWHHQVVTKRAEWVHEGGDVRLLGVRGRDAYFAAAREADRMVVRVRADGTVRILPKVPWVDPAVGPVTEYLPFTCVTPRGLDSLRMRQVEPDGSANVSSLRTEFGPVFRLDDRRARPRWKEVPGTDPLVAPSTGAYACGRDGLVLLHPPETSAWTDSGFTKLATNAPKLPDGAVTTSALPLPEGGLVYSDGLYPSRLLDGTWTTLALPRERLPWSTVGNLVVFQSENPTTGRTEIHVAP